MMVYIHSVREKVRTLDKKGLGPVFINCSRVAALHEQRVWFARACGGPVNTEGAEDIRSF